MKVLLLSAATYLCWHICACPLRFKSCFIRSEENVTVLPGSKNAHVFINLLSFVLIWTGTIGKAQSLPYMATCLWRHPMVSTCPLLLHILQVNFCSFWLNVKDCWVFKLAVCFPFGTQLVILVTQQTGLNFFIMYSLCWCFSLCLSVLRSCSKSVTDVAKLLPLSLMVAWYSISRFVWVRRKRTVSDYPKDRIWYNCLSTKLTMSQNPGRH